MRNSLRRLRGTCCICHLVSAIALWVRGGTRRGYLLVDSCDCLRACGPYAYLGAMRGIHLVAPDRLLFVCVINRVCSARYTLELRPNPGEVLHVNV